eukprot:4081801-Prorocentrum_lima.AAC.1
MTSSLVGSEMCIRDRVKFSCRILDPRPSARGYPAVVIRHLRMVGFKPVSYTHLTLPTICSV